MGSFSAEPIEGIHEAIDTARQTGVRLNLAHLAPGWNTVPPMTPDIGKAVGLETLKPIDEAIAEGIDINRFEGESSECDARQVDGYAIARGIYRNIFDH